MAKKKLLFYDGEIARFTIKIAIIPPICPKSDSYLFANLKRQLQGKRFGSDSEVIAANEAYFHAKDTQGIESLEKRQYDCIAI